jgi:hypothetical protein
VIVVNIKCLLLKLRVVVILKDSNILDTKTELDKSRYRVSLSKRSFKDGILLSDLFNGKLDSDYSCFPLTLAEGA